MPTAQQAQQHRAEVAALTALAAKELAGAWTEFDTAEAARDALLDLLPQLVAIYGMAAATLAADWYDDLRSGENVRGRFLAEPVDPGYRGADSLARWAVDPLFRAEPDWQQARTLVEGGLQRRIAMAGRETIVMAVENDPEPAGYVRQAQPDACAFCAMLATRDIYYNSAESALRVVGRGTALSANQQRRMGRRAEGIKGRGTQQIGEKYHDFCGCVAVPVWGDYEEPAQVGEWRAAYKKAFGQLTPGTEDYTPELLSNMRKILGSK